MTPDQKKKIEDLRRQLIGVLGPFYGSVKFNLNPTREKNNNKTNCNLETELDGVVIEESQELHV